MSQNDVRPRLLVFFICLAALLLRLFIVAQSPTVAPEAYDTIRQVEHIRETGAPLFNDPLAENVGTRPLPLFSYLVAFGTLVMPSDLAYALIPNMLAVLAHAALFFLTLELTNNRTLAVLAALASVFVPSYLAATVLTLSSLSLAIPLLFFALTLFIKLRKSKEHRTLLLAATIALIATHPIAMLLAPVLLLALILSTVRRASGIVVQYEYAVFATILIVWFHLLYYRDIILAHGLAALRGNLPAALEPQIYGSPTMLTLGVAVGLIPFALALYAGYREGLAKHPGIQATIALAAVSALAVAARLLPTMTGTIVFALACIPLAAVGLQHMRTYFRTIQLRWITVVGVVLLIAGFALTSILATVVSASTIATESTSQDFIDAAQWLRDNSLPQAVVLAEPKYGNAIAFEAGRTPYIDSSYAGDTDVDLRYNITRTIIDAGRFPVVARTEDIDYIILREPIVDECLHTVYHKEYSVQKTLCR